MGSIRAVLFRYAALGIVLLVGVSPILLDANDKKDGLQYGVGLMANVPYAEADVLKAVDDVAQNGKIFGTKEYNKDEFVGGATAVNDSSAFPAWTDGGKVFYKQRLHALDPRNFKDSNDVGTLTVRYVVMKQDDKHTVVRIDAIFIEEFRHKSHASDGSVENAEYKVISDRLEFMQSMRDQAAQGDREKQAATEKKFERNEFPVQPASVDLPPANASQSPEGVISDALSIDDLKQQVHDLKQQTEKRVRAAGAELKSAPFHTATNLQTLKAGAEVLIVISTPYWIGVETHDGQHGWVSRDDLEELP
ncbi:MAG TPA: SH3 domain-containing protein [Candidatus Eisenbacteria bacterium]|nr:SH3 domain-containing protein [Candidatus Eisenbacteria bacterium]